MAMWGMGVMVGPILGPTFGGWLTDSYNWRWVFFINVPVGILAALRHLAIYSAGAGRPAHAIRFVRFRRLEPCRRGVADAARSRPAERLVLLERDLDRGDHHDRRFHVLRRTHGPHPPREVLLRPSIAQEPQLPNRDFCSSSSSEWVCSEPAPCCPRCSRTLFNYPVATAGLVIAPTGIGTMFAMLIAGRIMGRVDLRLILFIGFSLTAFSLWEMTDYSLELSQSDIIWPGVIQGIGQGLGVRSLERSRVRHLEPANAGARYRDLQLGAQYRQQYRKLPWCRPSSCAVR